jgi:transcriptional regulator with XRE-family HTH domain
MEKNPSALPPLPGLPGGVRETGEDLLRRLGEKARDARLAMGWPQEEMALRAGVSFSAIKSLEAGRPVSVATLLGALSALGCEKNVLDLFENSAPSLSQWMAADQQQSAPRPRAPNRRPR